MAWNVERHASVGSTMDVARERAKAGAPDGTVVVAEQMTGGRGTHGRPWHAPQGGLYLSIVLRGVKDPHLLTLALGNAVAEALEVAGVDPRLKWVNDVWVDGKKIAGILVEGEAVGDRFDFHVAGIGINVNGSAAGWPKMKDLPTTLEDELACESCVPDLEAFLLQSVAKWVDHVRAGHDAEIVEAFRARDALQGRKVVVEEADPKPVQGMAAGIDARGRLLLDVGGTRRVFQTGTVRLA